MYEMSENEKRREAKLSREILELTRKRSRIRLGLKSLRRGGKA